MGIAILALLASIGPLARWQFGKLPTQDVRDVTSRLWPVTIIFCAAFYGFVRSTRFHPHVNRRYRNWLEHSPWTPDQPLPLGPITLAWQDAIVLILLIAISLFENISAMIPLTALCIAFVVGTLLLLAATQADGATTVLLFGLPLLVLRAHPRELFIVSIGLYLIAHFGLKRSLWKFPWKSPRVETYGKLKLAIGWPLRWIAPDLNQHRIRRRDAIAAPLLIGWSIFCVGHAIGSSTTPQARHELLPLAFMFVAATAVLRCAVYISSASPPISTWGRIISRNLILPNYDRVLIAPSCVLMIGCGAVLLSNRLDFPPEISAAFIATATLLPALLVGPTLQSWRCTSAAQFTRPVSLDRQDRHKSLH